MRSVRLLAYIVLELPTERERGGVSGMLTEHMPDGYALKSGLHVYVLFLYTDMCTDV